MAGSGCGIIRTPGKLSAAAPGDGGGIVDTGLSCHCSERYGGYVVMATFSGILVTLILGNLFYITIVGMLYLIWRELRILNGRG